MSLLSELNTILGNLNIPVETGVFSGIAPNEYTVLTPIADVFDLHADDRPGVNIQEVRISLFSKGNYLQTQNNIVHAVIDGDINITDRTYVEHEDDTGYNHVSIDVSKHYIWE